MDSGAEPGGLGDLGAPQPDLHPAAAVSAAISVPRPSTGPAPHGRVREPGPRRHQPIDDGVGAVDTGLGQSAGPQVVAAIRVCPGRQQRLDDREVVAAAGEDQARSAVVVATVWAGAFGEGLSGCFFLLL